MKEGTDVRAWQRASVTFSPAQIPHALAWNRKLTSTNKHHRNGMSLRVSISLFSSYGHIRLYEYFYQYVR